ncbi:hypothetical protein Acr_00g0045320 [Actinidia rufa]|uniref:Uncharacterized protein n=1 Tax=Actinidia rufa TaxID=165716 RepID=A0A7J0DKL6_9ERIC|nr:hypothetical protein Acr_00g0045320 [Actinidia rufa]
MSFNAKLPPPRCTLKWQLVESFYEGLTEDQRNMVDASCGGAFLQKSAEEGWALFETLNENSIQRASTARNGPVTVVIWLPITLSCARAFNAAQGYSRPVQMPLAYRPNIPPGYQQPPPPPPQRNTDFEEKVLRALQSFEVKNQTTSQLLSSHTQSIAKLENPNGQLANALSRRDEGKLPSQSVANPKGQYEVHDIHGHEQAKAIMTLRAGREIDTRPEEEKKAKKEEEKSSNNSKVVVSESPSPKGDVSLPPTCAKELPTAPRVLRAPFPACLTSPSSFDKKGVMKEDNA